MGTTANLFLLLLFSVLVFRRSSALSATTTVHIQNDIESYEADLFYHCMSNDDDLGKRSLNQGQEWYWEFGAIKKTHFWCDFRWYDNGDYHWKSGTFTVYSRRSVEQRKFYDYVCGTDCKWSARRDGLYIYYVENRVWKKINEWHVE
ncbi:hypothetical protein MKW94_004939 [Papaver nudicaule]|uniref:S-protein homolog n=1 Tax=Papaver nudicaule TaxID=74823 RepID=A0AA41VH76_PAPNU|nr:hypothetical protein [Papaver nudicaule]